ncbi:hypothetical protein KR026_006714, partial [Drosophila bipectinata]
ISPQCTFVILAICLMGAWAAVSEPAPVEAVEPEVASALGEKKTEKRGIYGFGYGHGGYGGYGHGHYGGFGYGSPYYGGYGYVHAPYYGGHHGYYPYHGHGHYGFY